MFVNREVRCVNPKCGALNRVPRYSIKRIPECGKCHNQLPENGTIKTLRKLYRFRGLLIFVAFACFITWVSRDQIREALNPVPACIVHAAPRQGVYRWYVDSQDVANFTIKTASGSDYFVKLEDASTAVPVRSFFVRGGSTLSNQVPLGTFILKFATGNSWCNEADLFGSGTTTRQADKLLVFERHVTQDATSIMTSTSDITVELILQPGGNLRTHTIPRSQF